MCDRECVTENSNYNMEIKWYLGGNYPNKNLFMQFFFRVLSSFSSNNEFCQKLQNAPLMIYKQNIYFANIYILIHFIITTCL